MMSHMYDLAWEIDGDNIRLEQNDGSGTVEAVCLHPAQLRVLAEAAGILRNSGTVIPQPRLVSMMRVLLRKLLELQTVIHEETGYDPELWQRLPLIMEVSGFLFEDITGEQCFEDPEKEHRNENWRNDNSQPTISVTSGTSTAIGTGVGGASTKNGTGSTPGNSKRGRPPTGEAKSAAERQKEYRDRQASQAIGASPP